MSDRVTTTITVPIIMIKCLLCEEKYSIPLYRLEDEKCSVCGGDVEEYRWWEEDE